MKLDVGSFFLGVAAAFFQHVLSMFYRVWLDTRPYKPKNEKGQTVMTYTMRASTPETARDGILKEVERRLEGRKGEFRSRLTQRDKYANKAQCYELEQLRDFLRDLIIEPGEPK